MTAKYIVKVLTGELRIGLREGLLEAAIARAFERPLDEVKWAGMLTGDVGETASLARDDRLASAELSLFHPLKFMLASPAEDANEILARLGPEVWVEDKYDGIRAQLHREGDVARLYSRDLHDVSGQFPEVVDGARGLPWDGILDGELLAYRDGAVLPFLSLQTRLGRKNPSADVPRGVPVIFVAFDLLAHGPAPLAAIARRSSRCSPVRSPNDAPASTPWSCRWSKRAACSRSRRSYAPRRSTSWRPSSTPRVPVATRASWSRTPRAATRRAAAATAG